MEVLADIKAQTAASAAALESVHATLGALQASLSDMERRVMDALGELEIEVLLIKRAAVSGASQLPSFNGTRPGPAATSSRVASTPGSTPAMQRAPSRMQSLMSPPTRDKSSSYIASSTRVTSPPVPPTTTTPAGREAFQRVTPKVCLLCGSLVETPNAACVCACVRV